LDGGQLPVTSFQLAFDLAVSISQASGPNWKLVTGNWKLKMTRLAGATALVLLTAWVGFGEGSNDRLANADVAWDRGDYPRALTEYLALLDGSPTQDVIEAIALQTGELFKTTELTTDGGAPRFSPDGRYLSYEVGRGLARRTRLALADTATTTIAELEGF
jgi:hypothetical protein